jgi:catechol 2,3-dioxygenase-like lactoylglutathione lyase family enzyme
MEPPGLLGVYETVLYGPDLDVLASFYRDVLGLRHVSDMDELGASFRLRDGGMLLLFDPRRAATSGRAVPSHGTAGPGHVALSIDAGDYDRWLAYLRERGVDVERELTWRQGGRSIYFRDPAGNSVELVAGEAWPP